jgi:hypothetical protein
LLNNSISSYKGVSEVILPEMSADETQALERSAATLRNAVGNYLGKS